MSTYAEHATDWDAQREMLSAFLDGRLTAEEDEALRRHLETCSRCHEELNELRRTVALLRALPQPALPRSFALPVHVQVSPAHAALPAAREGRGRVGSPWPRVAQWAGGLVAAAGLIVGIVGLAGQVPYATPRAASSESGAFAPQQPAHDAPSAAASSADGSSTPAHAVVNGTMATHAPAAPTVVLVPTPTQVGNSSRALARQADGPLQPFPALPIAGSALVIVGATTYAAGTRSRRRQR
jgi:Putative zinc-finger